MTFSFVLSFHGKIFISRVQLNHLHTVCEKVVQGQNRQEYQIAIYGFYFHLWVFVTRKYFQQQTRKNGRKLYNEDTFLKRNLILSSSNNLARCYINFYYGMLFVSSGQKRNLTFSETGICIRNSDSPRLRLHVVHTTLEER